jgi:hypothetical protein
MAASTSQDCGVVAGVLDWDCDLVGISVSGEDAERSGSPDSRRFQHLGTVIKARYEIYRFMEKVVTVQDACEAR